MPRRRRNLMLIWVIALGISNFILYTILYSYIGGDAKNGRIENGKYYVRGHFVRESQGRTTEVSKAQWVYSYIHSITIWPTVGLVLCSMMLLARPHIVATMREDHLISGSSFVTVAMTITILITGTGMIYFLIDFIDALRIFSSGENFGV